MISWVEKRFVTDRRAWDLVFRLEKLAPFSQINLQKNMENRRKYFHVHKVTTRNSSLPAKVDRQPDRTLIGLGR